MSIPVTDIFCLECGYEAGFIAKRIDYRYQLPDGEKVDAEWAWGWCLWCERIEPIQIALRPAEFQKRLLNAEKYLRENVFSENDDFTKFHERYEAETDVKNIPNLLKLINGRRTLPRCLKCGGVFQDDLYLKTEMLSEEPWEARVLFPHPGCGGELRTKEGDLRFAFKDFREEKILRVVTF
jgi:hypothetical protein